MQGAVLASVKGLLRSIPEPGRLSWRAGAVTARWFDENVAGQVREITDGHGADFVFDTVGTPNTLTLALNSARKGGTIVVTGLSRTDALASIPLFPFVMQEKRLIGSLYGSGQPLNDIPQLVSLHQQGKLKLQELVTRTYRLDDVNEALSALASAEGARGIIQW